MKFNAIRDFLAVAERGSLRAAAQRLKFAPAGIAPDELSMGMFGEFEIATCNRAAEALRPEQSQQAADAGGQAIPVTCAAPLHCLAASPRQREGSGQRLSRSATHYAVRWHHPVALADLAGVKLAGGARRRVAPVRGVTVAANQGAAWRSV